MKTSARALSFLIAKSSSPSLIIPGFLCPSLLKLSLSHTSPSLSLARRDELPPRDQFSRTFSAVATFSGGQKDVQLSSQLAILPLSCPGCGALTQYIESDDAGFYSMDRRSVKEYIRNRRNLSIRRKVEQPASTDVDEGSVELKELGSDKPPSKAGPIFHIQDNRNLTNADRI